MAQPPLVLLHGYPFDRTLWDGVRARLPGQTQVVAPNLPGFGGEAVLETEPSLEAMAAKVAEVFERERLGRAVLAGFSMGGYVALAFAERFADRLAGLALINSQPFADTEEVRFSRRHMIEKVRAEGIGAAARAALPKLFAPGKEDEPALLKPVERGVDLAGVEGITWALEAMARRPDRTSVVHKLALPLLLLHSPLDKFIPIERIANLARSLPRARYVEVAGAGHCTPLEAPAAVANALAQLMAGIAS